MLRIGSPASFRNGEIMDSRILPHHCQHFEGFEYEPQIGSGIFIMRDEITSFNTRVVDTDTERRINIPNTPLNDLL